MKKELMSIFHPTYYATYYASVYVRWHLNIHLNIQKCMKVLPFDINIGNISLSPVTGIFRPAGVST